jgi:hypothetical protein
MELIIALVLFIGLIAFWTILPGTTSSHSVLLETNRWDSQGEPKTPSQQPA